jgi:hypothetical protein
MLARSDECVSSALGANHAAASDRLDQRRNEQLLHPGGGAPANVAVVNGPNGQYLRTHADGAWNDNLLALAECT